MTSQSWWICLSTTLSCPFFSSLCPWGGCVNLILSAWYLNSALPPFLLLLLLFLLLFLSPQILSRTTLHSSPFLCILCVYFVCVCIMAASAVLRNRVKRPSYLNKLAKPEDLVDLFPNGSYIGWSGFTGVGYPKYAFLFLVAAFMPSIQRGVRHGG